MRRNYIFRDYAEGKKDIKDDFLQLFMLQPRNRTAKLLVSNKPCASCLGFRGYILKRIEIKSQYSYCKRYSVYILQGIILLLRIIKVYY